MLPLNDDLLRDYGTREHGTVTEAHRAEFHFAETPLERVDWADPRLAKVERLRLLSDDGFPVWDVSYCHGRLKDGTPCEVVLPFDQLPRRGMKAAIIKHAMRDKVYAKGLGLLDNISTLC